MFLFKASGRTYLRVVKRSLHAFPNRPQKVEVGQLVLLSKNREDCTPSEAQIQYVAKILDVRQRCRRSAPQADGRKTMGNLTCVGAATPGGVLYSVAGMECDHAAQACKPRCPRTCCGAHCRRRTRTHHLRDWRWLEFAQVLTAASQARSPSAAEKRQRPVRHATDRDQAAEEIGKASEMRVGQSVIQSAQVLPARSRIDA